MKITQLLIISLLSINLYSSSCDKFEEDTFNIIKLKSDNEKLLQNIKRFKDNKYELKKQYRILYNTKKYEESVLKSKIKKLNRIIDLVVKKNKNLELKIKSKGQTIKQYEEKYIQ